MSTDFVQPWVPPQELKLSTPRPIRRTKWIAAVRGQELYFNTKLAVISAPLWLLAFLALILWPYPPEAVEIFLWPLNIVAGFGTLGSIVSLLVLLPRSYFVLRRAERLLRWGRPARAVVTNVKEFGAFPTTYTWALEYHEDTGSLVKTKTRSFSPRFSVNQILTVLYDPEKPKRCITYPVAGYEVG